MAKKVFVASSVSLVLLLVVMIILGISARALTDSPEASTATDQFEQAELFIANG